MQSAALLRISTCPKSLYIAAIAVTSESSMYIL
jgi:hypothetical protein